MLRNSFIVYLKEIREVLRDRKSLIFMILLPTIIVPVLMNLFIEFVSKAEKQARTETLTYALFGAEYLPEFSDAFAQEEGFQKIDIATPERLKSAITEGKIKFGLVVPENARSLLDSGRQVAVELHFNNVLVTSKVKDRAGRIIQQVSDRLRADRLRSLGLESPGEQENLLSPIVIEHKGTADVTEPKGARKVLGERVGGILPYLFIIFCFMGALYPAIDLGAGEKERGTLETLLLAPVQRYHIVLGKFLVIFTTGIVAAMLSLTGIGLMLATKGKQVTGPFAEILKSFTPADLLLIALMLIPTAAMFAALLLSVSIYARSFKEASAYCGPLNFLVILPAFVGLFPWVRLNWITAMIPITNISLAIKEIVKGTIDYRILAVILTSSFVVAAALLVFCSKWFRRETVLFRQ